MSTLMAVGGECMHVGNAEPWEMRMGALVPGAGTFQGPRLLGFPWERAKP